MLKVNNKRLVTDGEMWVNSMCLSPGQNARDCTLPLEASYAVPATPISVCMAAPVLSDALTSMVLSSLHSIKLKIQQSNFRLSWGS